MRNEEYKFPEMLVISGNCVIVERNVIPTEDASTIYSYISFRSQKEESADRARRQLLRKAVFFLCLCLGTVKELIFTIP